MKDEIMEVLNDENPDAIFFSGLDDAIVGIGAAQHAPPVVIYSADLIIKSLINDGMEEEDAWEHFSYNIEGAYFGEHTPIIMRTYAGAE